MDEYVTVTIVYNRERGEQIQWEIPIGREQREERQPILRVARPARHDPCRIETFPRDEAHRRRIGAAVRRARSAGYAVHVF